MQSFQGFMTTNITDLVFLIFGVGLMIVMIKLNKRPADQEPDPSLINLPYEKDDSLLNETELKFLQALRAVVGDQYEVFCKVRIFDFINVKDGMSGSDNKIFEDKIKKESVNFLLTKPMSSEAVVALELEDIMDRSDERAKRDQFVEKVFKDARFPLLRFKVKGSYSNEIKRQLEETINFKENVEEEESVTA